MSEQQDVLSPQRRRRHGPESGGRSCCSRPSSPSTASGGAKALLSAADKERARLGIKQLSWSSSPAPGRCLGTQSEQARYGNRRGQLHQYRAEPGRRHFSSPHQRDVLKRPLQKHHEPHVLNYGAGAASTTDGSTWYTTQNFR